MTANGHRMPVLSVVMPAYNEEKVISGVVADWFRELSRLDIDHEIRVYDDGSRDRTGEILEGMAAECARLVVTRQTNRGHGATILRGYGESTSDWIFQVDADGELGPEGFETLWQRRNEFDFLLGYREGREAGPGRRAITGGSRLAVHALFGRGIRDVNSPYRLMRRSAIQPFLSLVAGTFAPNVILSGLALRLNLRIYEAPVRFTPRRAGTGSIWGWKLWRSAGRSLCETVAVSLKSRRGPRA